MRTLIDTAGQPLELHRVPRLGRRRVECYRDRASWLCGRSGGERIGGSDVPRVLGLCSFEPPHDWWRRRRGLLPPQAENPCEAARLGRVAESRLLATRAPAPRRWFSPSAALALPSEIRVIFVGSVPWMAATPDGFVWDRVRGWGGLEVKLCVDGPQVWGPSGELIAWRTGIVPPWVAYQVYWYLAVTGLRFWDVELVLAPGAKTDGDLDHAERRSYRLHADLRFQRSLVRRVGAWRGRHLLKNDEPSPTELSLFSKIILHP